MNRPGRHVQCPVICVQYEPNKANPGVQGRITHALNINYVFNTGRSRSAGFLSAGAPHGASI